VGTWHRHYGYYGGNQSHYDAVRYFLRRLLDLRLCFSSQVKTIMAAMVVLVKLGMGVKHYGNMPYYWNFATYGNYNAVRNRTRAVQNISESITYSTRVAMVFNTVRNGYTYPAARALLDAGTYTSPQAVSIEQSIDEHYQVYLTIPKPRLYFPRVYENNVGRVANWIILQSNKMYSDWQLGKKTNELQASAATYEKFGLLPEEADAIIQNTSSANLKDATQAAEFKMAAEAKNFYDNFMSASIDAEEASMAAIDISSPTTPIEVNKGEIKFGDPAPPNVITTFTSNKPFIVWERTGNDLLPIHLPAGTTQRYYAWAGKTKVEGIEDGTKIKISHLPK